MSWQHVVDWCYYNNVLLLMAGGLVLSIISIIIATNSNKRSLKLQGEIKTHSARTPFLIINDVRIITHEDGNFYTSIAVANVGEGIAIGVVVSGQYKTGELWSPISVNKIPVLLNNRELQTINLFNTSDYPEKFELTFSCTSEAGFVRTTKWSYVHLGNGRERWYISDTN